MRIRLLVICELMLIIAWVYLLFQWHPEATAIEPFSVPQANTRYAALRTDISRQLQAANEHPPALAFAGDSDASYGLDDIFDRTENTFPAPGQTPISFGSINDQPLTRTAEKTDNAGANVHPATSAPPATVAPAPVCPYRLSTIIRGAGRATVVLVNIATNESHFLTTGQRAGDWLIVDIGKDTITVRADRGEKTLWIE